MKITFLKIGLPLITLLALASCTPSYRFKVDAIGGGEIQTGESFYLVSANTDLKESDLRFKEAAKYVQTALEGKGMHKARDIGAADVLIELTFGVGEPREILETRSYPETYWRPGFSYMVRLPVHDSGGVVIGYQNRLVREPPRSYTYWEDRMDSSTVFEKFLVIEAFDNRIARTAGVESEQLWSVDISNVDSSDNMREYLPYMIAAALPYIAKDTGSQVFVSVKTDDPTVEFIRFPNATAPSQNP